MVAAVAASSVELSRWPVLFFAAQVMLRVAAAVAAVAAGWQQVASAEVAVAVAVADLVHLVAAHHLPPCPLYQMEAVQTRMNVVESQLSDRQGLWSDEVALMCVCVCVCVCSKWASACSMVQDNNKSDAISNGYR